MNYEKAAATLKNRQSKKIANNTYLVPVEGGIAVRLHATNVVTIHADGCYTLTSGGWQTVTTKDRINNYSPFRVSQQAGFWYVGYMPFFDGIKFGPDGKCLNASQSCYTEADARRLHRLVSKYVRGYASHVVELGNLQRPSLDDCAGCQLNQRHVPEGIEHLLIHMEEGEYVPSLLMTAIRSRGYRNPAYLWDRMDEEVERGMARWVMQHLNYYFRALKPHLLEAMTRRVACE